MRTRAGNRKWRMEKKRSKSENASPSRFTIGLSPRPEYVPMYERAARRERNAGIASPIIPGPGRTGRKSCRIKSATPTPHRTMRCLAFVITSWRERSMKLKASRRVDARCISPVKAKYKSDSSQICILILRTPRLRKPWLRQRSHAHALPSALPSGGS